MRRNLLYILDEASMPPLSYLLLHPEARLSEDETSSLFHGLMKLAESYQE